MPRASLLTAATTSAIAVLAVLLTACGGGDEVSAEDAPAASASPSASAEPSDAGSASATPSTPAGLAGTPADADLTDLLCARDAAGAWRATGTLTNPTSAPIDYRVTVAVGADGGGTLPARRAVLPRVAPRTPTPFTVEEIQVGQGDAPTCRVQVLRLP